MKLLAMLIHHSRPRFWSYLGGPALLGMIYGSNSIRDLVSPIAVLILLYFLIPANLFLYGVNDISDRQIDRFNPKKSRQERRYRGERVMYIAVIFCGILGLILIFSVPFVAGVWMLVFLCLAIAYSVPPFRLKIRPPLDSISNGLYVVPAAVGFGAITGEILPIELLLAGWFWTMAMHTFSAIPDISPDEAASIQTLATVLGRKGALVYCTGCWVLATVIISLVDIRLSLVFGLYVILSLVFIMSSISLPRAYWWFPWINTTAGMILTFAGVWQLTYGL